MYNYTCTAEEVPWDGDMWRRAVGVADTHKSVLWGHQYQIKDVTHLPHLVASHLRCLKDGKFARRKWQQPRGTCWHCSQGKGNQSLDRKEVQWWQWGLLEKERKTLMWSIKFCTVLWKQYLFSEKEGGIIYCITCCYTSVECNKMTATAWFVSPKQIYEH